MKEDLGDRWASVADRKRKEDIQQLIDNEVRRPPSRNDLVPLDPFVANRGLPADLKSIAERLIKLQAGTG